MDILCLDLILFSLVNLAVDAIEKRDFLLLNVSLFSSGECFLSGLSIFFLLLLFFGESFDFWLVFSSVASYYV